MFREGRGGGTGKGAEKPWFHSFRRELFSFRSFEPTSPPSHRLPVPPIFASFDEGYFSYFLRDDHSSYFCTLSDERGDRETSVSFIPERVPFILIVSLRCFPPQTSGTSRWVVFNIFFTTPDTCIVYPTDGDGKLVQHWFHSFRRAFVSLRSPPSPRLPVPLDGRHPPPRLRLR